MTTTALPEPRSTASGQRHPAVRTVDVVKTYGAGDSAVHALQSVSVDFAAGEFTAVMGPSGSGKSTLMHVAAGLDTVTDGRVLIGDTEVTGLNDKALTRLRRDRIGFVFQQFNLVPTLSAAENIELPMRLAGREVDRDRAQGVHGRVAGAARLDDVDGADGGVRLATRARARLGESGGRHRCAPVGFR